jgi:hypothetical protein
LSSSDSPKIQCDLGLSVVEGTGDIHATFAVGSGVALVSAFCYAFFVRAPIGKHDLPRRTAAALLRASHDSAILSDDTELEALSGLSGDRRVAAHTRKLKADELVICLAVNQMHSAEVPMNRGPLRV